MPNSRANWTKPVRRKQKTSWERRMTKTERSPYILSESGCCSRNGWKRQQVRHVYILKGQRDRRSYFQKVGAEAELVDDTNRYGTSNYYRDREIAVHTLREWVLQQKWLKPPTGTCTVDSRYLELVYLEFCETRGVYLNQKYNWLLSPTIIWRWRLFL